ncbi:MAG: substrate-binding periplasmic protein [Pseudoalteromonas prydzensis]|uniref:Transporter substrate-binding domain-containing protein n=1 Tax=Pseudoalteromonas prydzensis TaxID=182141 RepID=A0A7V1CYG1_9GAMM|nr:transporter substrate-binding domain-containing protein [Pseudoalteromonas prydzensis]HEA16618.1 transporter substrate-binding domain-containing protein [Pseudoalteromonas prydzensis]
MKYMQLLFGLLLTLSGMTLACERTLKVGTSQLWPPYIFNAQSQLAGIDIDIVKLVLQEAGFCSQFIRFPSSNRAFVELEKGRVDLLPAASYTAQRTRFSHFSEPYRREVMRLFWYPNQALLEQDLAGLFTNQQIIVVNSGSYYGEEFARFSDNDQYNDLIVSVPLLRQRLDMLVAKRIDFFIDDELAGLYLVHNENIKGINVHPYIINDNPVHFMLSKNTLSDDELNAINLAIINSKQRIQTIINNYSKHYY